jgi:hypothetical protein
LILNWEAWIPGSAKEMTPTWLSCELRLRYHCKVIQHSQEKESNRFLAVNLLTDAQQYRQAAYILSASRLDKITSPQYFLIAQSIELYLKAFIIAAGGKQAELKKSDVRHSLAKLFELATATGYKPKSAKTAAVIDLLAPHHSDHSFRYRKVGFKTYPTIREGLDALERMDKEIAPLVSRSISKLWVAESRWLLMLKAKAK